MVEKDDALRKRAEKAKAKALEYARKAQVAEKALSEIERNADTRRKILDGAHIQTEALNNPEIDALLRRLREEKLILDHDRKAFGLALLSEEEKDRRTGARGNARKHKAEAMAEKTAGKPETVEEA